MTPDFAVRLDGVGKRYTKLEESTSLLRAMIPLKRPKRSDFWALRNLDLEIAAGETVGLIGGNGAGKTTLLRLLAGVSSPTEGRVRVEGRVAPLISVGVGFHREMSGRENVLINGMLLGLSKAALKERFDEIVAFAQLEDFIDVPVKFYSSGMFMRLGFSVAVHTDPKVLLVDEVLAVGDSAFQLTCLDKMREIQAGGATIVLVSHSMHAIRLLCPRTVLIRRGELEYDGPTEQGLARHHELLSADSAEDTRPRKDSLERRVTGGAQIIASEVVDSSGSAVHYAAPGSDLALRLRVRFDVDVDSPMFSFTMIDDDGAVAYGFQSPISLDYGAYRAGQEATVELRFRAQLGGGSYRISSQVSRRDGRDVLVIQPSANIFYIEPRDWAYGTADLLGTISIDGSDLIESRPYRFDAADPDSA